MCNPENKIISSFPSFIAILKFGFFNLFDFKVLYSLADEKFHMKNRGKQFSLDRTWGPWVAFSPIKIFTNLTPHLWIIMTLNIIFGQQVLCTRNTLWPSTCRMWLKLSSVFEWRGGWVYFWNNSVLLCAWNRDGEIWEGSECPQLRELLAGELCLSPEHGKPGQGTQLLPSASLQLSPMPGNRDEPRERGSQGK